MPTELKSDDKTAGKTDKTSSGKPKSEVESAADKEALHKHVENLMTSQPARAASLADMLVQFEKVPLFADKWVEGLFFIGTFMIFTLIYRSAFRNCKCFKNIRFDYFMEAFFSIYNEAITIFTMLIIVQILDYYRYFSFLSVDVAMISYAIGIFLILFAKLGLIYVCAASKKAKKWSDWEQQAMDMQQLENMKTRYHKLFYQGRKNPEKHEYMKRMKKYIHEIHLKKGGPKQVIPHEFRDQLKYTMMRQDFISPVFIPNVTESYLRKDFNFAEYLGFCYGKTISKMFRISLVNYVLMYVFIVIFKELLVISKEIFIITLFAMPVVFWICFSIIAYGLHRVKRKLVPSVDTPETMNLHADHDIIDPFEHYDNLMPPPFIEVPDSNELLDDFEKSMNDSEDLEGPEHALREAKRKHHRAHPRTLANRHEKLFCCGRMGPDFALYFTQFVFLLTLAWFATFLAIGGYRAHLMVDTYFHNQFSAWTYRMFCWVPPTLMFVLQFVFMPYLMTQFTIVTNIQMMRDRNQILMVVRNKKFNSAMRSFRLYQIFKIIRRELVESYNQVIEDSRLRQHTKKMVVECFKECEDSGVPEKTLAVSELGSLARLCGTNINGMDALILLKKCKSDGTTLNFSNFLVSIEQNMNDVKIDAYQVVKEILSLYFNGKDRITMDELELFFDTFGYYFDEMDKYDFINEVTFIKLGQEDI